MFANFEQPDLKARFTFVVTAPSGWQIVSGQAEAARTVPPTAAGHRDVRPDAAPVHLPHRARRRAVPPGRPDVWRDVVRSGCCAGRRWPSTSTPEAIFTVTRQGLDFYDRAFGYPYPWGKYDSIFVPEYNLGAMENPGLVTFTEGFIHRGAATRADRARRAEVILHEMAHMWFGDLVTPRWWDGTWLKESFADLMGYHVTEAATEFDGVWTTFAGRRKAWAYRQDQLPTTHPSSPRWTTWRRRGRTSTASPTPRARRCSSS